MKSRFKQSVAASMFMAFGLANASTVTIPAGAPYYGAPYYGTSINGVSTLSLSTDVLMTLDVVQTSVTGYGAAQASVMKDSDGFYTQVSVAAPIASVSLDTQSTAIVAVATAGGIAMTAPARKSVGSGGSLTVTDLNIDLVSKQVYATLIGGNGVGTLNNVALWNVGSVTSSGLITGYDSHCGFYNDCLYVAPGMTLSGLRLTANGFNKVVQSLGLLSLGKSALSGVTDFGTITVGVVPEPSTPALMGLGLAGLLISKRRRQRLG